MEEADLYMFLSLDLLCMQSTDCYNNDDTTYDSNINGGGSSGSCMFTQDDPWRVIGVDSMKTETVIKIRTRFENPTELPQTLYSTYKYRLLIHLKAYEENSTCQQNLIAKVYIVDETGKKLENNAISEGPLDSKQTLGFKEHEGILGLRLDPEFSFYKEKKKICIQIEVCPSSDSSLPLIVRRSGGVKLFARKPNKNRVHEVESSSSPRKINKKRRVVADSKTRVQEGYQLNASAFNLI